MQTRTDTASHEGLLGHVSVDDAGTLSPIERDFMTRVLSTPIRTYLHRLAALGLSSGNRILDAGCGFGQWAQAMSLGYRSVDGIDIHGRELRIAKNVARSIGSENIRFQCANMEALPFADGTFDAVFSYSCLYFTDFPVTLREFHRVLAPGGRLYVCTNSYGWFLYNLFRSRHAAADYSPRRYALKTFRNALTVRRHDLSLAEGARITSRRTLTRILKRIGFAVEAIEGEGRIRVADGAPFTPNYAATYLGFDNVIELLARRSA